MINSGLRGKRTKDTVGILSTADHFNQQNYLIPTVTSFSITDESYVPIDDTAANTAGGQIIVVNGSGFAPGATVTVGGDTISVVTFVDSSRLAFTAPAKTSGSYTIFVTNANGGTGILVPGLVYSGVPTFYTAAGTLGSLYETTAINTLVEASGDEPVTFSLSSGSLPTGATLSANGAITGTSPVDSGSTTYSFTVKATDAQNQDSLRSFSLTINTDVVTWSTPAADTLYTLTGNSLISPVTLSAASAAGYGVQYTANSLPTGVSLSGNSITGTPTVQETIYTLLTATANTTGRSATRTISWSVVLGDAYWKYTSLLLNGSTSSNTFINDLSLNNAQLTIAGDVRPSNFNSYTEGYYSTNISTTSTGLTLTQPALGNIFTIEFWVYPTGVGNNNYYYIGGSSAGPLVGYNTTTFSIARQGGWTLTSSTLPKLNVWNHIAIVREGTGTNQYKLYINGVNTATGTETTTFGLQADATIGQTSGSAALGLISNFRITNNQALYTTTFTPSTTPLTATANTVLLTCQSNKFVDNSLNRTTIVPSGSPLISSAIPFATPTTAAYNTQYSTTFDGTTDYLVNTTMPALGSGDFTVECWTFTKSNVSGATVFSVGDSASSPYANIALLNSGGSGWQLYVAGASMIVNWNDIYFSSYPALNVWQHHAVVRSGSTISWYINGVQVKTTASGSGTMSIPGAYVGYSQAIGAVSHNGLVSNFRIVKGTALYTSNFTPSTTPLTAVDGTSLLTCQDATIKDNSTNNFTITSAGQAQPIAVSPFTMTTSNATVTSLGSAYFDGTGDFITAPASITSSLSGDWTVEAWCYMLVAPTGNTYNTCFPILMSEDNAGTLYHVWGIGSTGFVTMNRDGSSYETITGTMPGINQWFHVAVTNVGTSVTVYINGVKVGSSTQTAATWNSSGIITRIGALYTYKYANGYISDLRVTKGTALYTSNFLPSQAPLTPVANTQLLTCQTNGGATNNSFVDQSSFSNIITRAGNASQGTFSPYSQTGWSQLFNGSTDYYTIPSTTTNFGTGAWTIEMSFYINSLSSPCVLFDTRTAGAGNNGVQGSVLANGSIYWFEGSSTVMSLGAGTITTGRWYHVAWVRSGTGTNGCTLYIDGVARATGTSNMNHIGYTTYIGRNAAAVQDYMNGYISNLRIAKSAIVPALGGPTGPVSEVTGTQFLSANSNRFVDTSLYNNAITLAGTPSNQAFSPFGGITSVPTSYSNYFDGTGDRLFTSGSNLIVGTSDFTIECWVCPTALGNNGLWVLSAASTGLPGDNSGIHMHIQSGSINFAYGTSGTVATTFVVNQWYHLAMVRSSGTLRIFKDGVQLTTVNSVNTNFSTQQYLSIGQTWDGNILFQGYMSNFRFVKSALYTSAFTPSTTPLTTTSQGASASQVSVLTCQSNTMVDNSPNYFTLTASGDVKPKQFNPFGQTTTTNVTYTPAVNGGSMSFDGTGDQVVGTSSSLFAFGSNDFTIEGWFYVSSGTSGTLIDFRTGASTMHPVIYNNAGTLTLYVAGAGRITGSAVKVGEWVHVALVRSSGVTKMYQQGTQVGISYTDANVYLTGPAYVGAGLSVNNALNGYVSDIKVTNGAALYKSNFYPPTAPVTATATIGANTYASTLYLTGTSGGIVDAHSSINLETAGDTKLASEDPYGGSYYSNYFDGTGDYLVAPANTALQLTGDFTIEAWIYMTTKSTYNMVFGSASGGSADYISILSGTIEMSISNQYPAWTYNFSVNTWYHLAVTRSSNTIRVFVNGTQLTLSAGSATNSSQFFASSYGVEIGRYSGASPYPFTGYISNARIVKGTALYTSAFTPSTTPLTAVSGTSLLTCQSNTFKDNSTNNFTITVNGDTKVKSMNPFQNNSGKSLYFDGTGDWLQIPKTQMMYIGTGDFTIESWFYMQALPATNTNMAIVGQWNTGDLQYLVYARNNAGTMQLVFGYSTDGVTGVSTKAYNATGLIAGTWQHIAVVRSANNFYMFVNGSIINPADTFSLTLFNAVGPIAVGRSGDNANYLTGYVKDLRITKGVARYTTTFTPPTMPLQVK